MTKADIAKKQDHDRGRMEKARDYRTITSLNPDTKKFTVTVRSEKVRTRLLLALWIQCWISSFTHPIPSSLVMRAGNF